MGTTASKAAAVVAVAAALVVMAGCGGGKSKAEATHRAVVDAPSLTQAQLERAEVGAAELPGWTTEVTEGKGGYAQVVMDPAKRPRAAPVACGPVYAETDHLMGGWGPFTAAAGEWVRTDSSGAGEHDVLLSLRSYATAADADRVVTDLRTSLSTCKGQYGPPTQPGTYGSIQQLADPAAGDDAVAFRTVQTIPGEDPDAVNAPGHGLYHVVVVRSGATVATYSEFAMDGDPAAVPMAVVTAQTAKLAKAAAR
ncbi:hypothetical protein [Streptomyces sp. NPDC021020]|uniref:hypothetical protein n=1 Tax=Streptomyces sp. NPDC021020 TaxID=3365109 RepID=UPI0037A4051B